jgi:CrcB protein
VTSGRESWAAVAIGATAGALLRWGQASAIGAPGWAGTLSINVAGSFLLAALLASLAATTDAHSLWRPLVGSGFCGAYTTFSTFAGEVCSSSPTHGAAYGAASVVLCLGAAFGATASARRGARLLARRPALGAIAVGIATTGAAAAALVGRARSLAPDELLASGALVALGGALGSLARFGTSLVLQRVLGSGLPWGTLAVNVLGSLLLGVIDGVGPAPRVSLFLGTGCVGGLTTFSSFAAETAGLASERRRVAAALNVVANLSLGVAAFVGGKALAGHS